MVALAPVLLPWKKTLPELSRTTSPAEALVLKVRVPVGKLLKQPLSVEVPPKVMEPVLSNFGVKLHAKAGAGTARNVLAKSEDRRGHLRRRDLLNSAPLNRLSKNYLTAAPLPPTSALSAVFHGQRV